jgi:MtrB/PioB family decaheme-associated outer membrane protein
MLKQINEIAAPIALAAAACLTAAPQVGAEGMRGKFETGYQFASGDFGSEKYNQYRDEGAGPIANGSFFVEPGPEGLELEGSFANPFNRDQEYRLDLRRFGVFDATFGMSQLPVPLSQTSRSAWGTGGATGSTVMLALPAGFVRTPAGLVNSLATQSSGEDIGFRQRNWDGAIGFAIGERSRLEATYEQIDKQGSHFLQGSWRFTNFVQFARPLDEKTHNVNAGFHTSGEDWTASLEYDGSYFDNRFNALELANPIQSVASASSGDIARLALAPDNSSHQLRATFGSAVPAPFPTQVSGSLAYAMAYQDEDFLPYTANSFYANPALPQGDLDGEVRSLVGSFRVVARPTKELRVLARYRVHDRDNQTDAITLSFSGRGDTDLQADSRTVHGYDYRRQTGGVDARYRLTRATSLTGGYEWQNWNRDSQREVTHLNEHIGRAGVQTRVSSQVTARLSYEYRTRSGNSYDEPGLIGFRSYDLADRVRNDVRLSTTWLPCDELSLTFSGGYLDDDFDDSDYGVDSSEVWNVGTDAGWAPHERVSTSAYYHFERRREKLLANNAADWTSRFDDNGHNAGVRVDVVLLPGKLDGELGWSFQTARARTRASGDNGSAVDWPTIDDTFQVFTAFLDYAVDEDLTLRTGYRFERFDADDFHVDGLGLNGTGGNDVYLGDLTENYDGHHFITSVVFSF